MSKYQALTDYLLANCNKSSVQVSFDSINSLIYPQRLPFSAYMYREWWANDGYHSQANAWYKAGFFVSKASPSSRTVVFENSDTQRSPVTSNFAHPHIRNIVCPICKKNFNIRSINEHIRYEENKYFGNYIRFQTSKFVCGICYGIINNFSPEYLQVHKDKKCLNKEYMEKL